MTNAIVVGSGPNGLSAAVALAREGVSVTVLEARERIGGGTRSGELTVPGVLHDECSGIHPAGAASPFFNSLDLETHGLRWRWPEIDCTHPQDGGGGASLHRSISRTAEELPAPDGARWKRLFGPTVAGFDELLPSIMAPVLQVPKHPLRLARFGAPGLPPATLSGRLFRGPEARGLFAGCVAHAFYPFNRPLTASLGMGIIATGHSFGWPVAEGGSQAITSALASLLCSLGGTITTDVEVTSLDSLPPADIVMLDLAPRVAASVCGDRLPARVHRAYLRYKQGPAAFKVDYAVRGGAPWAYQPSKRAGTVHLGGTLAQIAAAEAECARGVLPSAPFVLVGQQYLADPARSAGDVHPLYAYAHVPHGWSGPSAAVTELVTRQIERFAPGFRDTIVTSVSTSPASFESYNANYIGGDIVGGLNNPLQLVARPRLSLNPYATGIKGVYLCSQSAPPGAGVHGMCGYNAAQAALRLS